MQKEIEKRAKFENLENNSNNPVSGLEKIINVVFGTKVLINRNRGINYENNIEYNFIGIHTIYWMC